MPEISTDTRVIQEQHSARRTRFEPTPPFTATNVQDAILQDNSFPKRVAGTPVTFDQSPYMPLGTDSYLLVDTSGGAITINLPASAARAGLPLVIKDVTGFASVNPINVASGEGIDGMMNYPIDSNFAGIQVSPRVGGYFVDA